MDTETMQSERLIGAVALFALVIATLVWRDTRMPVLHEVIVPVDGIEREVRVLHASDLHSSRFGERQSGLASLLAAEERFDAAVLTGDLVVCDAEDHHKRAIELADVALAHADNVFFFRGNHDGPSLGSELAARGVLDLSDWSANSQATTIAPEAGSVLISSVWNPLQTGSIDLLLLATHHPLSPASLETLIAPGHTTVVLAGHTHGGQVRLPLIGALVAPQPIDLTKSGAGPPTFTGLFFPDLRGLHVQGLYGDSEVYQHVSAGLGTHALPVRFGPRSSMTVLRFVPTASQ